MVDSADRVWIVYVVAAVMSAVGQFFRPAENALLPLLVGKEQLVPANALNALNDNLGRLIGPALGGLVAAWVGLGGVAVIDAASFLVAAGMIAAIGASARSERALSPDADGSPGAKAAIWREWLAGLRMVWARPVVRIVFGVFAIASIGEGVMQTAFWVFVDQTLGGATSAVSAGVTRQGVVRVIWAERGALTHRHDRAQIRQLQMRTLMPPLPRIDRGEVAYRGSG